MRERIIEAAEKIFSEKGFYEAKVYQIADLAEVSVGTIYRFFKSKEELYSAVLKKKLSELERRVEKRVKHKSPEEALRVYIETVVDFFDEERVFFIFMREVGSLSIIDEERFELSDWLGWPTGIQNTAGILMAVFSAVCMVRAWKIDARG
jgi:AcrR family transcriptional regulator